MKSTRTISVAAVILVSFMGTFSFAATYYVAPNGNNTASGSLSQPFATMQKGHDVAVAGDTVFIRGGTYKGWSVQITKSGRSARERICFWAYPGEKPYLDCSSGGWGISVTGSWIHVKGIEINKGSITTDNAHDNIFELMNCHHVNGIGIAVLHGTGGHLVLNCDSHDNFDAVSKDTPGENADGFGVHYQNSGKPDTIRGCRAWWNSDDGYDFINHEVPVTIENSWAMGAGYIYYGTDRAGNGNGFKIGSSKTGIRHVVRNCVAWKNRASGFYANHSSGGNTWYNNTSFQNGTQYNMLASTWSEPNGKGTRTDGVILTGDKRHIMRNNIGYPNKNSYIDGYGVDTKNNTWDLNITSSAGDFRSITDPSLTMTGKPLEEVSPMFGPRKADGSLPDVDFLKLAAGSKMIDKGVDVDLPAVGVPDLGAFEFGLVTRVSDPKIIRSGATLVTVAPTACVLFSGYGVRNGFTGSPRDAMAGGCVYSISGKRYHLVSPSQPSAGIYITR
ncbi:MAG: right-handed parallel beta-helix repeat-containing protein [Chitinispirillaceae bacterium]|nr:right-handed parallel beta-helix repeat-containing protein [Chitinispirillaceae bacterium]